MKRVMLLATVALMAMLVFAPVAMAQEDTMMEDSMMEDSMMEETASGTGSAGDLSDTGGPAILLPAAFLLLGSGILTYAVLRRR